MKKIMLAISLLCATSAAWATLVTDDFNRTVLLTTDASALGGSWAQETAQGWQISGDYLHSHAAVAPGILYNDALQTVSGNGDSFVLSMDVASKVSTAWAGVVFNYQNNTNYYMLRIKSDSTSYQLLSMVDGGLGILQNSNAASTFGEDLFYTLTVTSTAAYTFDFSITAAGSSTVIGSGANRVDSGSNFTGGYAGAYANSTGWSAGHDNFSLEVIPEPTTLGLVGLVGVAAVFIRKRFTT